MTDVVQTLLAHAYAVFSADPGASFAVLRVTPDQVAELARKDQIFDAVPLNLPGEGFPAPGVGPQWAIMERASILSTEHGHPTALLLPYVEGDRDPDAALCQALWDTMNKAHLAGYSLADFFAKFPSYLLLCGLVSDEWRRSYPAVYVRL